MQQGLKVILIAVIILIVLILVLALAGVLYFVPV